MTVTMGSQVVPKEIRRLDESLVNRIAAGEVIQRPSNAVKELLENSLDAGATTVTITLKDGGNKSIQVQDDGCGIRKEDLSILCERHTTSKLRTFEDLSSISTLGFRGEALASISYISHVTVTTMAASAAAKGEKEDEVAPSLPQHGWKASYKDGVMDPLTPRPAAATKGTIILAEDLFYNVPLRKKALKSASEEYSLVLDIVGRYAVFRNGAAIAVKKQGEAKADLATPVGATRIEAIRAVYGAAVAKNCLHVNRTIGGGWPPSEPTIATETKNDNNKISNEIMKCSIDGYVTGADYSGRKTQLILFINGRSVDFPPLKRCLEATYAAILPKAAKPFAFLDVKMPAQDVDVNVHPTKKEVAFLHQEELVEAVRAAVEEAVLASNAQRTFKQTLLPGAAVPGLGLANDEHLGGGGGAGAGGAGAATGPPPSYYRPDKLVRTDAKTQTLDAYAGSQWVHQQKQPQLGVEEGGAPNDGSDGRNADIGPVAHTADDMDVDANRHRNAAAAAAAALHGDLASIPRRKRGTTTAHINLNSDQHYLPTAMEIAGKGNIPLVSTIHQPTIQAAVRQRSNPAQSAGLESIERLLESAEAAIHDGLAEILKTATFVGLADSHRALLQSGTRLYLVDLTLLTRDMFYQQALRRFGQAPKMSLHPAVPAAELALIALEAEEAGGRWQDTQEEGSKEEVSALLGQLLSKKAGLLHDCFSVEILSGEGGGGGEEEELAPPSETAALPPGVDEDKEQQQPSSGGGSKIASLPQLIEQYHPNALYLPQFVLDLGQNVDWQEESACFRGIAEALADLYCVHADPDIDEWMGAVNNQGQKSGEIVSDENTGEKQQRIEREQRRREWEAAHVLLPALRLFLRPSRERASDGSVVELTRLENLYRIFERC